MMNDCLDMNNPTLMFHLNELFVAVAPLLRNSTLDAVYPGIINVDTQDFVKFVDAVEGMKDFLIPYVETP